MISLLVYLLVGVVIVAVIYWLLGEIISDPKLLKIARVIVAIIVLIALLYLVLPYLGADTLSSHRLFR
jgi:uncharacterized membrane protein YwzB